MYAARDICVQDFFSNKGYVSTVDKYYFLKQKILSEEVALISK